MKRYRLLYVLLALPAITALAAAADIDAVDLSADVTIESRLFTDGPAWAGQSGSRLHTALAATMQLRWRANDDRFRASLLPAIRIDALDDQRSSVDLREAYVAASLGDVELLVGNNTVFWGVTESLHLVDIVNQSDAAADPDGEDDLGQPMISLAVQTDAGLFSLYALPGFRERRFPGVDGRLRTPIPVATDGAVFESGAGRNRTDLALRYSHYFGDVDLGISAFTGTSREPRLLPAADGRSLLPHYDLIDQLGVDLQYTRDAWLWKLEAIVRNGVAERYVAAVGGFEYTRFQMRGSDADLGLLLEYQVDQRGPTEPLSAADNDLFAGIRIALNDVQDTTLLAGLVVDTDGGARLLSIESSRRMAEKWVAELTARFATNTSSDPAVSTFAADDYLQLSVSRYF